MRHSALVVVVLFVVTATSLADDIAQGCKYTSNLVCEDCVACVP